MVRDVATTMQPLVDKNENRLVIEVPPDAGSMHADLTKVRQVLFNLLSNACKFTEKGDDRICACGASSRRGLRLDRVSA